MLLFFFWHGVCIKYYEYKKRLLTPVGMIRCNGGHLIKKKAVARPLFFYAFRWFLAVLIAFCDYRTLSENVCHVEIIITG
jgi:hypothetical protein